MRKIIKRTAFGVLTLMMMAAALLWQNSPVEAAANITWTTTDIVLEDGKCTVYGYFLNNGDMDGTVTKMKFIVDVRTPDNKTNIYSAAWEHAPENCVVKAGAQLSLGFFHSDEKCPQFSGDKHWNVQRTIWTK